MKTIIVGAGGHAKVVLEGLKKSGAEVHGLLDNDKQTHGQKLDEFFVLGDDELLNDLDPSNFTLANGLGNILHRKRVQEDLERVGWVFTGFVHPTASVSDSCTLERDVQVHAGTIIQADAVIGKSAIINTGSIVEHDCSVGDWAHIAPRATLCGGCIIQECVLVGAGAVLLPQVTVTEGTTIKANSTIKR